MVNQVRGAVDLDGLIEGGVSFDAPGGAVADVAPDATAFVHRWALAVVQYTATYGGTDPTPFDAYVRGFRAALTPALGDGAYVNYQDPSITDFGAAYWGANYARLRQVKRHYDPGGAFTFPEAVQI